MISDDVFARAEILTRQERPTADVGCLANRCAAAFALPPFVHRAAFLWSDDGSADNFAAIRVWGEAVVAIGALLHNLNSMTNDVPNLFLARRRHAVAQIFSERTLK